MATLTGVTRDSAGAILGGVTVNAFDATNDALVAAGTSDAVTGAYSLTVTGTGPFYAVAHKAGSTFVAGTTRRDLTATEVADPPPVTGNGTSVMNLWTGVPTADGAMISARMNGDKTADLTRVAVSTSSDMSNPVYTPTVAPDATYRIAKHTITGKQANTEYFYAIEVDGTIDLTTTGRFRTLPPVGTNFTIALGACANGAANTSAFAAIAAMDPPPLMFIVLGDFHYANSGSALEADKHTPIDNTLSTPIRGLVHRKIPTPYMWDDHDFGPDNSTGRDADNVERAYRQPAIDMFRRRMPMPLLSEVQTDTVDYAFVVGRVRFVVSDLRGDKTQEGTADTAAKTMMGAAQKARWKAQIAAAATAGQFVCWITSVPWAAGTSTSANNWGGYNVERVELADYIKAQGMSGKVCAIAGDGHSLAISYGQDYATGGGAMVPSFQVGPLNSGGSHKGGPFEQGPFGDLNGYPNHFGLMEVFDNGTDLSVRWKGIESNTGDTIMSHVFTALGAPVAVPAIPPTRVLAVTAVGGPAEADLTITPPYSNGGEAITKYTVVIDPPGGVDGGANTTNLTRKVTGLTPGVPTKFKVVAENSAGTSAASPFSATVTPDLPAGTEPQASAFDATGGTITTPGDGYRYWTFTATGTDTLNVTTAGEVEYLVVAGGGGGAGGSSTACGGGGAGGLLKSVLALSIGAIGITVGAGGGGTTSGSVSGGNSSIGALVVATGGGGGAGSAVAKTGGSGGGGAGASSSAGTGAAGIDGQGFAGGVGAYSATGALRAGAGGGGSTSIGGVAASGDAGDGGTGTTVWGKEYAGGGGGSALGNGGATPVTGGVGQAGGGSGSNSVILATSAAANTGSGGGGSTAGTSGSGGSGIVIIRKKL